MPKVKVKPAVKPAEKNQEIKVEIAQVTDEVEAVKAEAKKIELKKIELKKIELEKAEAKEVELKKIELEKAEVKIPTFEGSKAMMESLKEWSNVEIFYTNPKGKGFFLDNKVLGKNYETYKNPYFKKK